jgi:hypothetical protein
MKVEQKKENLTRDSLLVALEKFGIKERQGNKNLAKHFDKLKWDIDGMKYQKNVRSEWD